MKVFLFSISVLVSLFFWKEIPVTENILLPHKVETEEHKDQGVYENLLAMWAAGQTADLSLQQTNPFYGQKTFRRLGTSRVFPDRILARFSRGGVPLSFENQQKENRGFYDYSSYRQESGYYIYTLRRIII